MSLDPIQLAIDSQRGRCGRLILKQLPPSETPIKAVEELSRQTQEYLKGCENLTQTKIADALDEYAKALTVVAPRLPKPLRNLPRIVAEAAHTARVAPTKAMAKAALDHAVAEVHKEIALVLSEDPQSAANDSGVEGTLNVAALALVNSGGL